MRSALQRLDSINFAVFRRMSEIDRWVFRGVCRQRVQGGSEARGGPAARSDLVHLVHLKVSEQVQDTPCVLNPVWWSWDDGRWPLCPFVASVSAHAFC